MAMMYRPKNLDYEKELRKAWKKMIKLLQIDGIENANDDEREYLNLAGEYEALNKYIEVLEFWKNHPNHL